MSILPLPNKYIIDTGFPHIDTPFTYFIDSNKNSLFTLSNIIFLYGFIFICYIGSREERNT